MIADKEEDPGWGYPAIIRVMYQNIEMECKIKRPVGKRYPFKPVALAVKWKVQKSQNEGLPNHPTVSQAEVQNG